MNPLVIRLIIGNQQPHSLLEPLGAQAGWLQVAGFTGEGLVFAGDTALRGRCVGLCCGGDHCYIRGRAEGADADMRTAL